MQLTRAQAQERITKLRKEINRHRYLYHVLDTQEISDAALDSLKHELYELEQAYPDLITPDSPTQRVSGQALDKFKKVRHQKKMLSIEDVFNFNELQKWSQRIKKLKPNSCFEYYCELKIDGFAISLVYQDSVLQLAATRGDGQVGEDVTQNVKTIEAIPLRLEKEIPGRLEVRGEIYMTKKEFERINKLQKQKGEKTYANPRNLAAGTIRQLDPKLASSRKLDFFAYELVNDLGQKTREKEDQLLRELGFKTVKWNKLCPDLDCVQRMYQEWTKKRNNQAFMIDGLVVKVNDNQLRKSLGVAGKAPRGMVAYKFPAEQTTTIIKKVDWNVGRTGVLTPLATFEPVSVAGTLVQHATLHNWDEIQRLGVKIGDTVVIEKAGDIIPKVVKVLTNLRTGQEKDISLPRQCPICGAPIKKRKKEDVAYYCSNPKCFATEKEKIVHFVSKKAFDIDGLGEKIVEQLLESGLIKKPVDIFKLKKEELEVLDRFAEKSAQNIIDSINNSRQITLARFIYALGIRHVGEETSIDLANYFGSLEKLQKATLDELKQVKDVGEVVAQSIYDYFHNPNNLKDLQDLLQEVEIIKPKKIKQVLQGQTIVITGTLEHFTRDEIKEKIRELGGDVSSSVSSKTDFVVVGKNPGSKYNKASELGVPVLTESQFLAKIRSK